MRWPALVAAGLIALLSATPAQAATDLTLTQRRQILRAVRYPAPNAPTSTRILDPSCIEGRMSTVDRRYAAAFLSNTPSCVKRFGGASGESMLVRRPSPSSKRWRRAGSVSDNCQHGEGGASDAVLRDLGCGMFF